MGRPTSPGPSLWLRMKGRHSRIFAHCLILITDVLCARVIIRRFTLGRSGSQGTTASTDPQYRRFRPDNETATELERHATRRPSLWLRMKGRHSRIFFRHPELIEGWRVACRCRDRLLMGRPTSPGPSLWLRMKGRHSRIFAHCLILITDVLCARVIIRRFTLGRSGSQGTTASTDPQYRRFRPDNETATELERHGTNDQRLPQQLPSEDGDRQGGSWHEPVRADDPHWFHAFRVRKGHRKGRL